MLFLYGLTVGANNLNSVAASVLPSGWVINNARSISDSGQITGVATYTSNGSSQSQAYVLSLAQAVPGDANLDGKVDVNDLTIVLSTSARQRDELGHGRLQRRRQSRRQRPDDHPLALWPDGEHFHQRRPFRRARTRRLVLLAMAAAAVSACIGRRFK